MRKIIFFIFLIISGFLFTKNAYATCIQKLPGNVGNCTAAGSAGSPFDCKPITGIDICCKDQAECVANHASPAAITGPCAGLDGSAVVPINPNSPFGKCTDCVNGTDPLMNGKTGVWTALGCVQTDPTEFVAQLLSWVMGLGGGIAFLLIVWGGFQILTSSGNPEKLNDGKEIIVSALTGLLMIVFSVILLHLIGVDILHIPGF